MAAIFNTSGSMLALFLLATGVLLALNVNADDTTIKECKSTNPMRVLDGDSFDLDYDATRLFMSSCGLRLVLFGGLPNLITVDLTNNIIDEFDPSRSALWAIPTLKNLYLSFNKLTEAPVFEKETCPQLTELEIEHNQITAILNPDTFSVCRNLKLISLSNNRIHYIHPQSFSKLTELEILYLNTNWLQHIPEEMLAKNHKLEQLTLENNKLTRLPPDFVVNLKRNAAGLFLLYLFDNPWHCTCLVELLSDIKRAKVPIFGSYSSDTDGFSYDGLRPECVYFGMYPCHPHYEPQAPSRDQSAITYS